MASAIPVPGQPGRLFIPSRNTMHVSDISETDLPAQLQGLGQISNSSAVTALKVGSRGPAVTAMQKLLTSFGYPLEADGIFGVKSEAAVKLVQKKLNLVQTGIWDATTSARVMAITQSGVIDARPEDKATIATVRPAPSVSQQVLTIAPSGPGSTVVAGGSFFDKLKAKYDELTAKYPWYPYVLVAGGVVVVGAVFLALAPKPPQSGYVAGLDMQDFEPLGGVKRKPSKRKKRKSKSTKKKGN